MKLRWYGWVGIALLAVVVMIISALMWMLNTNAGARFVFERVRGITNDALHVANITGTLAGPLTLSQLTYRDPKGGIDVAAEQVSADVALLDLLHLTVHITTAELQGVAVNLNEPSEPPPPKPAGSEPFTLDAPLDLIVDRFVLTQASVVSNDAPLVTIDNAQFAGQWVGRAVAVRQLDVQSPQGEVHFAADVRQARYYEGNGQGRFRWQVGTREFAGSLEASARGANSQLLVELAAPLTAKLTVELQQLDNMPWQFALDAPSFDPREELLPDSSLQSLAAQLTGEGSLREGVIAGTLTINQEPIDIERMHFVRQVDVLDLDSVIRVGGGNLTAKGTVRTSAQPLSATATLRWGEIVVPASLAGQTLFTRGDVDFNGSAESYSVNGAVSIGPEKRVANLELKVQGSPERVHIEQLDIVQTPGRFAANGTVELQPTIGWSLTAQARQFDPGAFAVQWPGSLNFDLTTAGSLPEAGPQATLVLKDLRGRLRNRELRGAADLELTAKRVIAGRLNLASGRSSVRLVGQGGDVMDAVADIDVPTLNDWLPDGDGELRGRVQAQGRWPELNVSGQLNGRTLRVGTTLKADALALQWNIDKPTEPSGSATFEATQLAASGFEFATIRAQADGDMSKHSVDFDATGAPLATSFLVEGSLQDSAWTGSIQRLVLKVQDVAELTLQDPVAVSSSPERIEMSRACFVDRDIRLCAEGNRAADGAMQARYEMQNVPLGLANAFAPASLPLRFDGTLEGTGDVASTADGVFSGRAEVRSASGNISRQSIEAAGEPEVLLRYADLNLGAELDGANARAQLRARLDDSGSLNGQVSVRGLAQPDTAVDGDASMSLPSLRVIELFAPQLANVQGRADLRASVNGPLDAPQIDGEFRILDFATDLPAVGLKLRQGTVSVTPIGNDRFKLAAGIVSGPGRLAVEGEATTAGAIDMKISGRQFQAADIPSANVLIDPDLQFVRTAERMQLTGALHVPSAAINLQKLPQGDSTQGASDDVVIIDAQTQEEAQAEAVPLEADIKVTLGEKVTLAGYGLEARVLGQLAVKEQPGSPTSGSGEVRVEGTYKAYGQDLKIRQGQLLFAGTPLDNPRLSIVAVREVGEVVAGFRVSGSAQNPQLTVFSEPAMGQSDALAYIVTGKPLSEVGQGDGEGDALQSAARSLGSAAGGLLAKNIGKRLGVDEFGVKDSEAIGGAALTVGQYLSPRLYLSYGVGLFEPGEVITLRYKLSKTLALEALNGPQDSRAGVEYRMER